MQAVEDTKGLQLWISNDMALQIVFLRATAIVHRTMARLLRIKDRQLTYFINHYRYLGWQLYLSHYKTVDYFYCLSNSIIVPRAKTQAAMIESFTYGCTTGLVLMEMKNYISSIPESDRPNIPTEHAPLFTSKTFPRLWAGALPPIYV